MELYHEIKKAKAPADAKRIGRRVPYNPEWERIKPTVMFDIQLKKHEQYPQLEDELCEEKGIFMEASYDSFWGTGVPITDPALDTGEFCGRNELGLILGRVQKLLLSRKEISTRSEELMDQHPAPHKPEAPIGASSGPAGTSLDPVKRVGPDFEREGKEKQAHSMDIEVLEENIQVTPRVARCVLEPQIAIKEGVIVV